MTIFFIVNLALTFDTVMIKFHAHRTILHMRKHTFAAFHLFTPIANVAITITRLLSTKLLTARYTWVWFGVLTHH